VTSDEIGQDENPNDNSRVRTFEVTSNIYSLDNIGNHPAGTEVLTQAGSASFTDNPEGLKLMTMYYVNTPMVVTGFQIGVGPASRAGGTIAISILDTADVFQFPAVVTNPVNGIESDPFVLTTAHVTADVVNIPFPTPITLQPNAYYAVATVTGNGTTASTTDAEAFILDDTTVPQPNITSAIWLPFDIQEDGSEGPHFYSNGTAWAIRMSTNPTISIAENTELEGVSMYPNPTNGLLNITTTMNEKYTVEVMNVLGEVVSTSNFNGMTTMDLSGLASGVYNVRIATGTKATVQRITLN
jgi:hypothetical protein